jgi:hypothetical protein
MGSIIESLHEQSEEPQADMADLVARGLFAAKVLREGAVSAWLKCERDGYQSLDSVPAYRRGSNAKLLAWRPGVGWVEAPITDAMAQAVADFSLTESIADLAADQAQVRKAGGRRVTLADDRQREIRALTSLDTDLCMVIPSDQAERVLSTVRIGIRLWSQALLDAGVSGQGSSFTAEERKAASEVAGTLDALLEEAAKLEASLSASVSERRGGLLSRLLQRVSA